VAASEQVRAQKHAGKGSRANRKQRDEKTHLPLLGSERVNGGCASGVGLVSS